MIVTRRISASGGKINFHQGIVGAGPSLRLLGDTAGSGNRVQSGIARGVSRNLISDALDVSDGTARGRLGSRAVYVQLMSFDFEYLVVYMKSSSPPAPRWCGRVRRAASLTVSCESLPLE
jgi:hypothetical protein